MGQFFAETLDGSKTNQELKIIPLTGSQRLKSALKISLIFLALAMASVFIPVLHFFLVPGFTLASVVTFWLSFTVQSKFETESMNCPNCGTEVTLSHLNPKFPLRISCKSCNNVFYLKSEV